MYNKGKGRVYFSINGLGLGHASRCSELIKEMLKDGKEVYISTYGQGANYFEKLYRNVFRSAEIKYHFDNNGRLSFKLTLAREFIRAQVILFLHIFLEFKNLAHIKPNIVISDSRLSTIIASYFLKLKSFVIINQIFIEIPRINPINAFLAFIKRVSERIIYELTFYWWIKAKYILVPDFPPPYSISSASIRIKSFNHLKKIFFIGPLVDFSEFNFNQDINGDFEGITVVISGTKEERLAFLRRFIDLVSNTEIDDIFYVFTGLENLNGIKKNIKVIGYTDKYSIKKRILNSKLVILSGGHSSLLETIFYEKPFLILLLKGHTEKINNAKSLSKMGCCEYDFLEDISPEKFKALINNSLKNKKYYLNNIIKLKSMLENYFINQNIKNILNEN